VFFVADLIRMALLPDFAAPLVIAPTPIGMAHIALQGKFRAVGFEFAGKRFRHAFSLNA
jgi:hypothetical protein